MKKRTLLLGLVVMASSFAQGCCWYNRPHIFPRVHAWRCGDGCSTGCYGPDCGCATDHSYLGTPTPIPGPGQVMPGAQPLTRATFPQK